jgi:hypothetical protein
MIPGPAGVLIRKVPKIRFYFDHFFVEAGAHLMQHLGHLTAERRVVQVDVKSMDVDQRVNLLLVLEKSVK